MNLFLRRGWVCFALILVCWTYGLGASPNPVRARHGMVVSAHRLASEVGVNILKKGGNAIDAAVAVGFALAVVFPEAGNIGGGGFMLIRMHDGKAVVIDFREKAPKASTRDMYIDSSGEVIRKSLDGHLSVAVPGTVAGLLKALDDFGSMSRQEVIQPAVQLAEAGFPVDENLEGNFVSYSELLTRYPSTMATFAPDSTFPVEGDTLRQPDLAATLRRIQTYGADDFYRVETARLIVGEMQHGGGIITKEDLTDYEPVIREPIIGSYRGYDILTAPPPSSGGICLVELLNLLEGIDLASLGFHSSSFVHVLAEAMKRVYADRAEYMGDPDFADVPVDRLISKKYAEMRRNEIDWTKATPASIVRPGLSVREEGGNTTHYVVVDSMGNVVSTTYTINDLFGSKVVVGGAGFFLNDEMDDFSAKPGVPNAYGLIGGDANAIEPEKRPLSSMTPTIVLKDGKPILALGARGGSRIITAVLQTIINVLDFRMDVQLAIDAPRIHHQWLPDTIVFERFGPPVDVVVNLRSMGHAVKEISGTVGALEAIAFDPATGWIYGASDPREGGVAIGY